MDLAFHALADPHRRAIVELLALRPSTVGELLQQLELSQPALSKQLRVLRDAGLVAAEFEGRFRRYRLVGQALGEVGRWLLHYRRFWEQRLDSLGDLLDEQAGHGRRRR